MALSAVLFFVQPCPTRRHSILRSAGNKMKDLKTVLFGFSAISIFAVILAYLIISEQHLNPADYVAGLASVSIVFLTAAYVFITSRQLAAMKDQLDEMKKSREHSSQPMAFITPSNIFLEKPRLYFSPPEKEFGGHSRLHVECIASNPGNAPALSVNVCACIMLQQGEDKHCGSFRSTMEYIDILALGEDVERKYEISFLFPDDRSGKIIDCIRASRPDRAPVLRICAAYKNMLGACFACRQAFQIFYNKAEQDEILENWQSQISAFDSMLKNEIKQMSKLYGKNEDSSDSIFQDSKEKYETTIKGDDQKLKAIQIPKSFTAFTISESRYTTMLSKSSYGQFMPAQDECIAIGEAEQQL